MATQDVHMALSLCAGADLANGQIVFSHDSKYFACCAGWNVKVYNTINGQCTQVLDGHKGVVTGLAINPANKLQLLSCGMDGVINQWVYLEGVLLRTYSFYMPLHALVTVDPNATSVTAIAHRPQSASCSVLRLPLKKKRRQSTGEPEGSGDDGVVKPDVLLPVCRADHRTVSHGCNGQYIAAVDGHDVFVYSTISKKVHKKLTSDVTNPFTCVACHPTEACMATGHSNGKITLWWNFYNKKDIVMTTFHWHSLAVQCLAFSPEGSSLLSGGQECVLVRWQMNSEHKDFLPRLGSPLHSITVSPEGTLFVTAHSDNVLQIISSSFKLQQAVRGLVRAHQERCGGSVQRGVGLVVEPRSGALVTNGRPGHLQFYCMATDCQLFNLDIVGENYVSPDNLQKPHAVTEVEQAAFDPSGDWLATCQRWDDGVLTPESCLKFWRYNRKKQNYQLNTTVEIPHYKAVKCLRFKPCKSHSPLAVSTGQDGFFKLWTFLRWHARVPVQQWTCESLGHYGNKAAGEARFSADGNTLAVVFDNILTLWDHDSNVLMDRIIMEQAIRCVEFVNGDSAHYIVVSTSFHLTVLDLSTLTVHMQMLVPDALLATDGDLICAVTSQQDLCVFRPNEDQPVYQKKGATEKPVVSAVFLPLKPSAQGDTDPLGWHSHSTLYLMDSMHRMFTPVLGTKQAQTRTQVQLKQVLPQTPFQTLLTTQQELKTSAAGQVSSDHYALHPLQHLDVMNERFSTEAGISKRALCLLETLMVTSKGLAECMDVEQAMEEEDVTTATDT